MQASLPDIRKALPCLKCGCNTDHKLVPYEKGTMWKCMSCKNHIHAFTKEEMMRTVVQGLFNLKPAPVPATVPAGFKVFIKSDFGDKNEREVPHEFVVQHAEITGALPELGKPLFARPKGIKDAPAFMAVPYGEVVRIETTNTVV